MDDSPLMVGGGHVKDRKSACTTNFYEETTVEDTVAVESKASTSQCFLSSVISASTVSNVPATSTSFSCGCLSPAKPADSRCTSLVLLHRPHTVSQLLLLANATTTTATNHTTTRYHETLAVSRRRRHDNGKRRIISTKQCHQAMTYGLVSCL